MGKALILGLAVTPTSASTKITKNTDKAPIPLQMATNTSASSKITKGTDKAPIPLQMATNT